MTMRKAEMIFKGLTELRNPSKTRVQEYRIPELSDEEIDAQFRFMSPKERKAFHVIDNPVRGSYGSKRS